MQSYMHRPPNPLLAAGVLAGPFFMLVATFQEITRPGFHLLRCQVSHLAIGDFGWIQAINFFVTGALVLAFALGLRQPLRPQKLLPALLGLIGIGLMAATFSATDRHTAVPLVYSLSHPASPSMGRSTTWLLVSSSSVSWWLVFCVVDALFSKDSKSLPSIRY